MANPLAPPQQPNPLIPPGMNPQTGQPLPGVMPPPPPSPSLGFQSWASDPMNAHKVVPAMTKPDQPLRPNAGMASANPPQQPSALTPPATKSALTPPGFNPQADQQSANTELQRLRSTGSGASQIQNPIGRGFAKAGDIALSILSPGIASLVPGTSLHNKLLQQQQAGRIGQDQSQIQQGQQNELNTLDIQAKQQGIASGTKAASRAAMEGTIVKDGTGKPIAWVDGDGVTHAPGDSAIPEGVAAVMGADKGKPPASDFELWQRQNPNGSAADFQKMQAKPLSAEQAQSLNAVWDPLAAKHHLPNGQFQPGMSSADATALSGALNNAIGKQQGDQHISIDLQGLSAKQPLNTNDPNMQAAVAGVANGSLKMQDVFGRGATTAQKAQFVAAVKQVNPKFNSGDNAIENESRKYFITGQGGTSLNSMTTALHHLDLLDKAADAMHNGDVRSLNAIGNELGIQTGNDAPTNFKLIRDGVAMEAARAYTGGVPGEGEINDFRNNLSGDGSPRAIHGGANTVRGMLRGKMQSLVGQAQAGASGQPNFAGASGDASSATGKADYIYVPGKGLVKQ